MNREIALSEHWSFNLHNDPKRFGFVLARYKFAADLACRGKRVLELGASEGIGMPIIMELAHSYVGVDLDVEAIDSAKRNWEGPHAQFHAEDFLGKTYGSFDSIISLDVIEHIDRSQEDLILRTIDANMPHDGICVIGTPNVTSAAYASPASQAGHINLYDGPRLSRLLERLFHNVFLFGMNDEVGHTSYVHMAHYLIAVGCNKRDRLQ